MSKKPYFIIYSLGIASEKYGLLGSTLHAVSSRRIFSLLRLLKISLARLSYHDLHLCSYFLEAKPGKHLIDLVLFFILSLMFIKRDVYNNVSIINCTVFFMKSKGQSTYIAAYSNAIF